MALFGQERPVLLDQGCFLRLSSQVVPLVGIPGMVVEFFTTIVVMDVTVSLRADAVVARAEAGPRGVRPVQGLIGS